MRSIYTYLDMGILTARNIDLKRNTKGAVRLVFDWLEKRFGTYDFQTMFEYLLTDRGSEFSDPDDSAKENKL